MTLDPRFKLPKITYKGTTVQLQRIRKKKESQIQEFRDAESNAPQPGTSASRRASGEDGFGAAAASGPLPPDFCVFYSLPLAEPLQDAFSTDWGAPPQEPEEVLRTPHLCGMDLPLYRVNEFSEKFRGTMRNKAQRAQKSAEKVKPGEAETKEMLAGRTCVVQVRMPDLDPHVPSLKQFGLEVSDECMRLGFPMLPRSGRAAYSHLTIWWCATEAQTSPQLGGSISSYIIGCQLPDFL
ncbi:unnamed protein product [Polarella glacialis]|uniref:Uncharacterized protein n=1 Tax=Polarella glacialis TaxID=89957 RepID=A0A813JFG9_POLGL|nr:unnamed protein product [Polarella glacialis]